ncbi:MAG TPA: PEP-CTERM sorting domain-containing protein, partial [Verrucomicrobiae bacterium]|nr:PEP-CTERM sorting domain-containing protein [Verrucomicrobiae bacterium]
NLPSAPFAGFNSQAGGSTDAGYSQATQNSAITPYSISSASFAAVSVATGLYGSGFAANAEANSIFEVGFNIQQPLDYHFSAFQDIEAVGGFISFEMSSANHGDIFNSSTESTFGNNNLDYSGILPPDDYTFRVQEYLSYNSFGSSYAGGNMNCNLVLSVPEPATIGPFLALIWLGMVALKRKLAKA